MMSLADFRSQIDDFDEKAANPTLLVPFLAYFLEETGTKLTGASLLKLFDEIRVRRPSRISDVLHRSKHFGPIKGGYQLSHSGRQHVTAGLLDTKVPVSARSREAQPTHYLEKKDEGLEVVLQDVFVIYGRDEVVRQHFFALLRALGCHPLEFSEIVHQDDSASPYTWDAIRRGFDKARACVVLFTPDESAALRPDLQNPSRPDPSGFQPRQNVLIEAGMAMALQPSRTLLVRIGEVRENSDFGGHQYIDFDGSAVSRNKLRSALEKAGCQVSTRGDDWLTIGTFKPAEGAR